MGKVKKKDGEMKRKTVRKVSKEGEKLKGDKIGGKKESLERGEKWRKRERKKKRETMNEKNGKRRIK